MPLTLDLHPYQQKIQRIQVGLVSKEDRKGRMQIGSRRPEKWYAEAVGLSV
jgi:hypothetical protein